MVRQTSSTRPRPMNCDCVLSSRELGHIPLDSCLRLLRHPFEGRSFTYLPSCFTCLVDIVQQILLFTINNMAPLFLITYPWIASFVLYPLLHSLRRSGRRIRPNPHSFLRPRHLPIAATTYTLCSLQLSSRLSGLGSNLFRRGG